MIGKNIKALRKKFKLTLQQLADRVGCSKGHLCDVENTQKNISFILGCNLAKALGIKRAQDLLDKDYDK